MSKYKYKNCYFSPFDVIIALYLTINKFTQDKKLVSFPLLYKTKYGVKFHQPVCCVTNSCSPLKVHKK